MIYILALCLMLTGCVSTTLKTEHYTFSRTAFAYDAQFPSVSVTPSGTVKVEGYSGQPNQETVDALKKVITELIAKGVIVP